ncbi:MAG: 4Fe-4S dicluster protein [Herbinix sp.]|jgi:Na+-translocating ferredoxin:NAD+ oxidoreductase RnfD subunit/NAD-dependent dihydropyrimidine dehydrogenase PreA subunit|nr:4Fe-4S dicluster protein [Herbinix sp.]
MKVFPLIRRKWSNEHIMAGVFFVLILYHIPQWVHSSFEILVFLLMVAESLVIDSIMNHFRYHRMWCCVSAAVTAAMLSAMTYGIPLWGRMAGVAAALLVGKHIWGGTGRNLINPALSGLLLLALLFDMPYPYFTESYLLIPAAIFSLPFLRMRPFAGIGLILGMMSALLLNGDFTLTKLLSYGVFFWGCLVITDPVTVTAHPVVGAVAGFLAGISSLYYFPVQIAIVISILTVNLFSAATESIYKRNTRLLKHKRALRKIVPYPGDKAHVIDLTGEKGNRFTAASEIKEKYINAMNNRQYRCNVSESKRVELSMDSILERIRDNDVFGRGGAAFPTYDKIIAVKEAEVPQKYLIINGAECDPGLIHDRWLIRNQWDLIMKGIVLLNHCVGFTTVYLAVKDVSDLQIPKDITVHKIKDYYPAGAEKILITEVLKIQVGPEKIPADLGILVLNVQTVYSLYEAVIHNKTMNSRFLTVADLRSKRAHVVKVKLGMRLSEVMDAVFPDSVNVFAGGGVMQAYLAEEDAVVDKRVNFIATSVYPNYKESPQCSKCAVCSSNCPVCLKVYMIVDLVDRGLSYKTGKYHADECIGCGSCSYSCMAGRDLAAKVFTAKSELKKKA